MHLRHSYTLLSAVLAENALKMFNELTKLEVPWNNTGLWKRRVGVSLVSTVSIWEEMAICPFPKVSRQFPKQD